MNRDHYYVRELSGLDDESVMYQAHCHCGWMAYSKSHYAAVCSVSWHLLEHAAPPEAFPPLKWSPENLEWEVGA